MAARNLNIIISLFAVTCCNAWCESMKDNNITLNVNIFAYSDNKETMYNIRKTSPGSFSSGSYGGHWENIFIEAFDTATVCLWFEGVAAYESQKYLSHLVHATMSWKVDSEYMDFKQQLNNFNSNDITRYLANYIDEKIEFQVISGDYSDSFDANTMIIQPTSTSTAGKASISSTNALDFSKCVLNNPPVAVFLSIYCQLDVIEPFNLDLEWRDIEPYIFPNAGDKAYHFGLTAGGGSSSVNGYKYYQYMINSYGYLLYSDFESDKQYNDNDISKQGIPMSFYTNYPQYADGIRTDVNMSCDKVVTVCDRSYCDYTFKWQSECTYDGKSHSQKMGLMVGFIATFLCVNLL